MTSVQLAVSWLGSELGKPGKPSANPRLRPTCLERVAERGGEAHQGGGAFHSADASVTPKQYPSLRATTVPQAKGSTDHQHLSTLRSS